MPQILAVTTQGHYTEAQRDALRADIMRQLDGCDAVVLILPPGVRLQNTFLPAAAVVVPQTNQDDAQRTIWRQEYNALPPADREAYGGFAGFVDAQGGFDPYAPQDEEPPALPPHVWLYRKMLTDHQIESDAPLFRDETNGQYAVAIDDLTDEQRAIPHVAAQLAPVGTLELKIEGLV